MSFKGELAKLADKIQSIPERPILTATIVLFLLGVIVIGLSFFYYTKGEFYEGLLTEAHGMLFDLAIIGILLYWLNQNGQTRQRISR